MSRSEPPSVNLVDVLSRGSQQHFNGRCTPCHHNGAGSPCPRGTLCDSCHYHHGEQKLRAAAIFAAMKQRRRKEAAGAPRAQSPGTGEAEAQCGDRVKGRLSAATLSATCHRPPPRSTALARLPVASVSHACDESPPWSGSSSSCQESPREPDVFAGYPFVLTAHCLMPVQCVHVGPDVAAEVELMLRMAVPTHYED